ncbi:tetratricopeptide repeat protein [Pseudomonas sp. PIC25]|uniref:tetratricopeptide repeat protein n=1 Tax=Pseudomonas sp. PIC25 TaxID=1958773 RepID=UPI000BAB7285|nr:tetratricopeptide repeat protein [Pseudomonas sp. PIC25]
MKGRISVIASFLLSGCATSYYNPNITDAGALERQRIIDEGYCTQVAAGSVPMPEVRHYQSGIQNYQITGNTRTYGSDGYSANSYYSGNVTAYPSSGDAFSAGMANGMNMGAAIRAGQERKQVMQGCMYSLGWTTDKHATTTLTPASTKAKTQGEEFFEIALADAEAGDPKMQTRVATAYMEGKDAPKDLQEAIRWLDKASAQGYSEASFQLAYIYSGRVDPQYADTQMMLLSIQKAAEQGEGMAQSMLGSMYYSGSNGLPQDTGKAIEWYKKACGNNDANGFLGMGTLYALGHGLKKDPIQAHRFFTKSEELGNPEAAEYRKMLEEHMTEAQIREANGL